MEQFVLKDQNGNSHTYQLQPHPAREGTRLVLQVMTMAAEPVGRILESKLADLVEKFMDGQITMEDEVADIAVNELGDIEWHAIASDIRKMIVDLDDPQALIRQLLKYTTRDGQNLSDDGVFDVAYQQNYLEMLKAASQAIRINGFLGFTGSLSDE